MTGQNDNNDAKLVPPVEQKRTSEEEQNDEIHIHRESKHNEQIEREEKCEEIKEESNISDVRIAGNQLKEGDVLRMTKSPLFEELELTVEELQELFNKNTASFRCLAQILLSRSSLLRHPLYHFPPLEDPGIDNAFNYVEPEEPIDNVCADKYRKLCKDMHIVPLSRVIKSLPTKCLNLRYYGLTNKQLKAVARSLKLNTHVEEVNFEENFLSAESAYYIEELLRENNTIRILNMKECRIGPLGAARLAEGIMLTQSLQELDLSHNNLEAQGIKALYLGLKENGTIKRLNLSHNELGVDAAPLLAGILKENYALEDLDLSWNNLGHPVAMKALFHDGITENKYLRSLNLAWNGISSHIAVKSMAKCLKDHEIIEFLDLGNNSLGDSTFRMVNNAVAKNKSLRGISLASNALTPDDALVILQTIMSNKPNFIILDMENIIVKKDFLPLWRKATRQGKKVKISGVLGNWTIKGPAICKLLFDRAQFLAMKPKKKRKKRDFGHFVFSLPDKPMRRGDFDDAVKKFKMKTVDRDLLQEIVSHFPYKKKGIDCIAMKEKYHELYPDAQPAPKKKKKGKHKKKHNESTMDTTKTDISKEFLSRQNTTLSSTFQTSEAESSQAGIAEIQQDENVTIDEANRTMSDSNANHIQFRKPDLEELEEVELEGQHKQPSITNENENELHEDIL